MREIKAAEITSLVEQLLLKANYEMGDDVIHAIEKGIANETSPTGKNVLSQILENQILAKKEQVAICQDTGMVVAFVEYGQELVVTGGAFEEAVNEGVRRAYKEGYLRKSVVRDPLFHRDNTGDNTPAVIHTTIVPGDQLKIELAPKGFGSENMSAIKMFAPSAGMEGVKQFIIETVLHAGPNTCPPSIVGVGIGGTFEQAGKLAKQALLRGCDKPNPSGEYEELEQELLKEINELGIGPAGLGGSITSIAVNIETYPTHIASIPVAVNLCCHAARHAVGVL